MEFCLDRKPTFPRGANFLNCGTIQHPIVSAGAYEIYKVQPNSGQFGIVIHSVMQKDILQEQGNHLRWWKILGDDRIKIQAQEIRSHGESFLFLACIAIIGQVIPFEDYGSKLLIQPQAESLILDLVKVCKQGVSQQINSMIQPDTVVLCKAQDAVRSVPLLVRSLEPRNEPEAVASIAKIVYFLTTGINTSAFVSTTNLKKAILPPANHWNKDIGHRLSSLLGACLDPGNMQRVVSFSDLELRLSLSSEHNVTQTKTGNYQEHQRAQPTNLQESKGLAKVAGMSALKELLIEEVVRPIENPEPYKKYGLTIPNGILLYGPLGCGKTYIARQLAEELNYYFMEVGPSEIASPFIHDSVLKIRDIFATAEQQAPSLIFIDEFEALVPSRSDLGGHQQYKSEEVNEFLVHLNECASKGILVIAATNEPDKIDAAIRRTGRLDKIIYVGPPDTEARVGLLEMYLSGRPLGNIETKKIASLLESYSCSDVRNIVIEAARLAFKEDKPIDNGHLAEAIRRNPSSLSSEILLKYNNFQQRGI